jgi:competence ComEA-like helix-hairpin-helix protein
MERLLMTRRGANGTDEQLARVTTYFLENLTLVNVNSSPADELGGVLGVSDDVAQAIIARRERQPFANLAQLRAVPGVVPDTLDQRKSRILF